MRGKAASKQPDRRTYFAMGHPSAELFAALRKSALDSPNRQTELAGGLLVGQPFKMAKDHRRPHSLGEPLQGRVEFRQVTCSSIVVGPRLHLASSALDRPPAGRVGLRFGADPQGDSEEPARERINTPDRSAVPGQDQKRRLRGVFRIMEVAQDVTAHAQNHAAMALDERGERGRRVSVAAAGQEPLEQQPVRQRSQRTRCEHGLQVFESPCSILIRHRVCTPDDAGLHPCSTGLRGSTANFSKSSIEKCRSLLRGGCKRSRGHCQRQPGRDHGEPANGHYRTQPANARHGQSVKASRKDQRAHQEEPARGLKRDTAAAVNRQNANGEDRKAQYIWYWAAV